MPSNLPMVDDTPLAAMHELQGVFDGDDMIFAMLIGIVDDRCECGRFSAARWASDQDKSLLEHGKLCDDWWKPELFGSHNVARNEAKDSPDAVQLAEKVGTVASQPWYFIRKIDIAGFLESFDFAFWGNFIQHRCEFIILQDFIFDPLHIPTYA